MPAYAKNEQTDMTGDEKKAIREFIKTLKEVIP
jgi:hypothetical protein